MIDDGGDRKIVREVGDGGIERWKDVVRWREIGGSMGMENGYMHEEAWKMGVEMGSGYEDVMGWSFL